MSIVLFSNLVDDIQKSRAKASADTCYAVRKIALGAIPNKNQAKAILSRAGFGDCPHYGQKVTSLILPHKKASK